MEEASSSLLWISKNNYEITRKEDFQYVQAACPECNHKFACYENLLIHFEQCCTEAIEKEALKQYKYIFLNVFKKLLLRKFNHIGGMPKTKTSENIDSIDNGIKVSIPVFFFKLYNFYLNNLERL